MSEAATWAASRRRRASPARLAAAVALHALVLLALGVAFDRVELSVHRERSGTLVPVALAPLPPPPPRIAPPPPPPPARSTAPRGRPVGVPRPPPIPAPRATDTPASPAAEAPSVTLPVAAAPASAPASALLRLDAETMRLAVRDVARRPSVAGQANLADPRATSGDRLTAGVDAAQKGDCSKGEFFGGGAGLLSLPFLAAAAALGKCSPH